MATNAQRIADATQAARNTTITEDDVRTAEGHAAFWHNMGNAVRAEAGREDGAEARDRREENVLMIGHFIRGAVGKTLWEAAASLRASGARIHDPDVLGDIARDLRPLRDEAIDMLALTVSQRVAKTLYPDIDENMLIDRVLEQSAMPDEN